MKRHHVRVRQGLLIACGVLFIAFGISAFFGVPGGHDQLHHTVGHNLTHIIAGLVIMDVAIVGSSRMRRSFCLVFGAIYFAIGLLGLFSVRDSLRIVPGLIEFHLDDNWIQIATGFVFLALGAWKRKSPSSLSEPEAWAT